MRVTSSATGKGLARPRIAPPRISDSIMREMKIIRSIKGRFRGWQQRQAKRRLLRRSSGMADEITRSQWAESLNHPTEFWERCFHYFHTRLPEPLREHRTYFATGGRGFGEESFHVMWFLLFREFAPESFLEIGVFRGQTLKSRVPARTPL